MFTANDARQKNNSDLDKRIEKEVNYSKSQGLNSGYLRVYIEDWFVSTIEEELQKRGFHSIRVPDITLKGDVYFSWADENDELENP